MKNFIRYIFNACVYVVLLDLKLCFGGTDNQCGGVTQCRGGSDKSTQTCADQTTNGRCEAPPESPDKTIAFECYSGTGWKPCKGPYLPETAVAIMKCNSDYLPLNDTNKVSFCRKNEWIPPIDNCYKKCEKLIPINVNLECYHKNRRTPCDENSLIAGVEVRPTCKLLHIYKNFVPEYETITCQPDGKWSDPLFTCRPECGLKISKVKKLIAYGKEEQIGDSPWHVAIYENKTLICGGTLIHPSLILSAAHCFYDTENNTKSNPERYEIAVSKFSSDYYTVDNDFQKTFKIKEIRFSDTKGYFDLSNFHGGDIALLIVEETITISPTVLPACIDPINSKKYPPEDTLAKVSGWGRNEFGLFSERLRTANLPFISRQRCFDSVSKDFQPFITTDKFCAGSEQGAGVLQGDSGGGLLLLEGDFYYVRGIVSVKQSTESKIAAFTDLADYIHWILNVRSEIEREILKRIKSQGPTRKTNQQEVKQELPALKNSSHVTKTALTRPIWMNNGDGVICSKSQFQCVNQQCIDFKLVCDGRNDCADGSDEITFNSCRTRRCNGTAFRCNYGACIDARFKCDGKQHCADGSDESIPACNKAFTPISVLPNARPTAPTNNSVKSTTFSISSYGLAVSATDDPDAFIQPAPSPAPSSGGFVNGEGSDASTPFSEEKFVTGGPLHGITPESLTRCSLPDLELFNIDVKCFHNDTSIDCKEELLVSGTRIRPTCKPFHVYDGFVPSYFELVCQDDGRWDDFLFSCRSECGLHYKRNNSLITDENSNNKYKFKGFPWHVAIFEKKRFICGGTIIHGFMILSAASCFYDKIKNERKLSASDYEIVVSKSTPNYTIIDNAGQKTYKVKQIQFKNKNYLLETNYVNDIAILLTEEKIQPNPASLPVCVDVTKAQPEDVEEVPNNVPGEVGGWENSVLPFVDRIECLKMAPPDLRPYITLDKSCTRLESGSKMPLPNPGSGWFTHEDGPYTLKGIASAIHPKSGIALFTRVSHHIDWMIKLRNEIKMMKKCCGTGLGKKEQDGGIVV